MILRVPLQTAGIQKGSWMWWWSCSIPAELPRAWGAGSHQHPCPPGWAPTQPGRPCCCLGPTACLRRKNFPLPLEEPLWRFPPKFALNQDTQLEPARRERGSSSLHQMQQPRARLKGQQGWNSVTAQARAGCCHPAGARGQRARAGSTVLATAASLRNSSYSRQYLFAQ